MPCFPFSPFGYCTCTKNSFWADSQCKLLVLFLRGCWVFVAGKFKFVNGNEYEGQFAFGKIHGAGEQRHY